MAGSNPPVTRLLPVAFVFANCICTLDLTPPQPYIAGIDFVHSRVFLWRISLPCANLKLNLSVQVSLPEPGRQVVKCKRTFNGSGQGALQRRRDGASVDRLGQPGRHSAPGAHPATAGLNTVAYRFPFVGCWRTPTVLIQDRVQTNRLQGGCTATACINHGKMWHRSS